MALFPQQFIDDLRLQANIVTVVQEYVPLKKAGTTYKGLCPFHSEKTPSFHVNPEKGFFHCFGCGLGGGVFKFLELHEKIGFQDAVRMLAQKFGVAIPEAEGTSDDSRRDSALRESLLKVHVELQPHDRAVSDLNVVGCTVDEAISKAERFLDESLLTDHRTVRLIHGYGTGQLKRALADFLQQHPLVARFDAAPPNQGGGGVTVVELKD